MAFSGASSLLGNGSNAVSSGAASAAATPPSLLTTGGSVAFGNVVAGVNNTQTLTVWNGGTMPMTVTQIAASGNGFSVFGFSLPLSLAGGQGTSFTVAFEATAPGSASGTIAIASTAAGSPSTISLSATVVTAAAQISVNPASLSFGGTAIGVTATQNVTLTNTGNSDVTVSSVSTTGAGFSASGVSNVMLAPNQAVGVAVSFDPTGAGFVTGSLIVTSNAPQELVGLSGAGAAPHQHSVTLNWSPSASAVVGYYVYRGTGANGQLSKLSTSIDAATSYVDTAVVAGQSYTYAVTAVGSDGVESAPSTPATATIPTP